MPDLAPKSNRADRVAGFGHGAVYQYRGFHGGDAARAAVDAVTWDWAIAIRVDCFIVYIRSWRCRAGRIIHCRSLLATRGFPHAVCRLFTGHPTLCTGAHVQVSVG